MFAPPAFHTPVGSKLPPSWVLLPPSSRAAEQVSTASREENYPAQSITWTPAHDDPWSPIDAEEALILRSMLGTDDNKPAACFEPNIKIEPGTESPMSTSDFALVSPDRGSAIVDPVASKPAEGLLPLPSRVCSIPDCEKSPRQNSRRKAQSSPRRCEFPGCTKNSQSNGRCIRHGGGKRCAVEGCPRGAQARGRCKSHGGGVRCKVEGCTRSSQGSGLCRTHGGGKLCDYPGCKKGTQRQGKCSRHGGARHCQVEGCCKVDRGGGLCGRHKKEVEATFQADC